MCCERRGISGRPLTLTQSVFLQFGHAAVDDFGALGNLPCLKTVELCFQEPGSSPLGPITGVAHRVDLGFAKGCPHLEQLNIDFYAGPLDCAPLAGLRFLASLDFSQCTAVTDLTALAECPLTALNLKGCTSLVALPHCKTLRDVKLQGCMALRDISPLLMTQVHYRCSSHWYLAQTGGPPVDRAAMEPFERWYATLPSHNCLYWGSSQLLAAKKQA